MKDKQFERVSRNKADDLLRKSENDVFLFELSQDELKALLEKEALTATINSGEYLIILRKK